MADRSRSRILPLALAGLTLAVGHLAGAHSGVHPLFVADSGTDEGDCQDARTPCRTIGYALSKAGKAAEIRLAAGSYAVDSPEILFHLVSNSVNVSGGYARRDGFERSGFGTTTLTGVPHEYRALLEARGFNVIADSKGLGAEEAAEAGELLGVYDRLKKGAAPAECVDGVAGDLACESVDVLSHVPFGDLRAAPAAGNDVWGFVDLNTGREYTLAGFDTGTAVIDVTDPANPVEVAFVQGQRTTWRDVKVYQLFDSAGDRWRAYAYVTADGASDGLIVIDMSGLPHTIEKVAYQSDFLSAHNAYLAGADYSTGIALAEATPVLIIAGSDLGSGQYRSYSLSDPAAPAFIGGATAPDYMHDASSVRITDARKDTCANGGDYCEVLLDFNENTIDLWDITDPEHPERLHQAVYSNSAYTHSGWWSEDRQFMFVHDELDEQRLGLTTTVRVFSLADLRAPVQIGEWTGPTNAIDHNGFVRGNRYYMSNYSRGLTVLDISDPAVPKTVGSLDTYPFSDNTGFQGAWGAYPFFFSGAIAIQDIDSGLFLARDRSRDTEQGRFAFAAESVFAEEGQAAQLTVRRTGGLTGSVSVGFEFLGATAGATDFQGAAGRLDWADGDTSERTVSIPLANDDAAEGLERLFVRLVDPQGGATLGDINVASVYVGEPAAPSTVGFFEEAIEVAESGFGKAVLVLRRGGSARHPASVDYALAGGSAESGSDFDGSMSGTLTWDAGDGMPKNLVLDIADDGNSEGNETFEVRLSNPAGATIAGSAAAQVTIAEPVTIAPPPPAPPTEGGGGSGSFGWLILTALALAAGLPRPASRFSRTGGATRWSARDPGRWR
ncbi:MAG TPA: choice-of-anchor B family protein [Woeseiaceae bacterium]|nr:choice-of-anchor B family protein [Woeseiaceae bacterium]